MVRALAAEEPVPGADQLMSAACSLPGVLLSQVAAMRALISQGMDFAAAPQDDPDAALCEERDRMVRLLRGDSVRCSRWLTN